MKLKSLHVSMRYFPQDVMRDTPANKDEVARARKFAVEVEKLARRLLPNQRSSVTVKEKFTDD